jgi:hypothetical protein
MMIVVNIFLWSYGGGHGAHVVATYRSRGLWKLNQPGIILIMCVGLRTHFVTLRKRLRRIED